MSCAVGQFYCHSTVSEMGELCVQWTDVLCSWSVLLSFHCEWNGRIVCAVDRCPVQLVSSTVIPLWLSHLYRCKFFQPSCCTSQQSLCHVLIYVQVIYGLCMCLLIAFFHSLQRNRVVVQNLVWQSVVVLAELLFLVKRLFHKRWKFCSTKDFCDKKGPGFGPAETPLLIDQTKLLGSFLAALHSTVDWSNKAVREFSGSATLHCWLIKAVREFSGSPTLHCWLIKQSC